MSAHNRHYLRSIKSRLELLRDETANSGTRSLIAAEIDWLDVQLAGVPAQVPEGKGASEPTKDERRDDSRCDCGTQMVSGSRQSKLTKAKTAKVTAVIEQTRQCASRPLVSKGPV